MEMKKLKTNPKKEKVWKEEKLEEKKLERRKHNILHQLKEEL